MPQLGDLHPLAPPPEGARHARNLFVSASSPTAPASTAAVSALPLTSRQIRLTLLGVMLGMLLAMLDNTIVGTALPTIVGDLGGLKHLSWVVTAYTLATAVSTPVWGKLGDLRGRKDVFLAAIAVFITGSVLSGAAQSMIELIGFRALQGLGAGGLAVSAFAIIADLVSPRERGRYQGHDRLGDGGGHHRGSTAGRGDHHRPGLAVGVLHQRSTRPGRVRLVPDHACPAPAGGRPVSTGSAPRCSGPRSPGWCWSPPGAATSTPGLRLQVLALSVLTVAALVAFIGSQRRAAEPVLPLRIFAHRNLSLSSVIALVAGVVMFGCVVYLPQFQQSVQGADATGSGLLLLPLVIPIVVISQIVGRVMSKTGKYKIFPILGTGFLIAGMALLGTMNLTTGRATTSVYVVLIGIGLGFSMQLTTIIAQNSVDTRDLGVASAAVTLFRTIGGSVGVALFGSLFTRALSRGLPAGAAQPTAAQLPHLPVAARDAYLQSVAAGTRTIFTVGAFIAVAALIAAMFIIETPLRGKLAARPTTEPNAAATGAK